MRLLSGADGVEKWNKKIWEEILGTEETPLEDRVRVVVSTHQILLDALTHGFVNMKHLCLIVFDEAHHCIYSHPANKIMQGFYHPARYRDEKVPVIMGLTASPLFNGGVEDLSMVEQNLDAICRTPLASRSSLQSHSRLPILKPVGYGSINQTSHPLPSASFPSLMEAYNRMDIGSDPYILSLPRETEEDERAYQQAIRRGSTECRKFIKNLFNKLTHLNQEYGSWAADFYIHKVIEMYTAAVKDRGDVLIGYVDAEKMYILEVLSQIRTFEMTDKHLIQPGAMTPKVEKLISILVEEYGPEFAASNSTFAGLIFVEQRVAVSVVAEILSRHPKTKDIFRCGSLLGSSAFQKSKDLVDLVDQKGTKTTLADFKSGQKNLLIATSVAEEGLDVQACNLVVSTYLPNTKKSYVQMRGRARRVNSTYVLMYENAEIGELALNKLSEWEKTMIQAYEDQTRELILPEEEDDEQLYDKYKIERTGALLTFESVIPHLHHFCAVIPRSTSAGIMPEFSSYRLDDGFGLWRAEVTLPSCIPPELRKHQASHNWNKQKTAEQDAAFNAYIALHKAGLVDDNFMPLPTHDPELEMDEIEKKSASKTVPLQLDPWDTTWNETSNGEYEVYISEVRIIWDEADFADIHMLLPFPCPKIATFYLWWTNTQPVQILVQEAPTPTFISSDQFSKAQDTTYTLFTSVFGNRMETDKKDFPYLFTPLEDISKERVPAVEAFHNWATMGAGDIGIVRDVSQNKRPFLFKAWNHEATITPEEMEKRWSKYELIPDMPLLEVTPIPKRRNFSHKGTNGLDIEMEEEERERIHDALTFFLLPEACTFDKLPWRLSKVALLIPCILRRVEMYAIAQELQRTILEPADLRDIEGIVTAITATSSREFTNYQKYEILGDSVLKFLAGIQLLADYPLWHEGYLSGRKDRSVANSKLATESVRLGMSRFIITGLFSATKWRPKYLTPLPPRGGVKKEEMALGEEGMGAGVNDNQGKEDEVQAVAEEKKVTERSLSTKILADIVESLMGAAFLEGGFNKAMQVAKVFGLSMKWDTLENRIEMLLKRAMEVEDFVFPAYLRNMEEMIGYTFKHKPLLLEAITHPGCNADTVVVSYQRLEFLGDSVLDMAIVDRLFRSPMDYGHVDIHLYKSASVNADFLAFLCLNLSLTIENAPVKATVDNKTGEVVVVSEDTRIPFHKFLRHSTREVAHSQALAHKNYLALRDDILDEFEASPHYPWTKLSALTAEKFFSDMVESIIGAVFIDSHGDWEAVDQVMQRFMILPVLDSLLERNADPRHPITKVGVHAAKTLSRTKYVMGIENNALTCEVYVNDVLMGKAVEGLSRAEVRTRAAEIAYFEMLRRDAERVDGQEEELSKKERKKRKGKGKEKVVENEDEIGKPLENEKENEKQITTDEPIEIKKKKKRKGKGKEKENVMEGISQVEVEKEAEQQRPRQDRVEDLVEASTIEKRKRAERERTSSSTEDLGITRTERKRRKTIEMENDTEVDLEKLNNLKEPVDPDALAAMMVTMLSI
ncbi:hypothetical protein DFH27DRAFT_199315 [Peziza echinospora]|nr:hypothetical protein DFH27DRAFT_199315 [Peziza echinospora]